MKKVWVFKIENERHVVELDCDTWLGGRKIYTDGQLTVKERSGPFDVNEEYRFNVGDKPALLEIRGIIIPQFVLTVDGRRV